MAVRVDDIAI